MVDRREFEHVLDSVLVISWFSAARFRSLSFGLALSPATNAPVAAGKMFGRTAAVGTLPGSDKGSCRLIIVGGHCRLLSRVRLVG